MVLRRILVVVAMLVGSVSTGALAGQPSGELLYRRYCASCHGIDGRGDGPVAPALVSPPADLTRVDTGVPELMRQIDGRAMARAHGTAQMPVWGRVFEETRVGDPHPRRTALQEVEILADYVHRLQKRTDTSR
jgi:mono/diheme cytochrome c family protein